MKQIVIITAVLAVITIGIFGWLYILELKCPEIALSNLIKVVAAIVLLGGCSALISFLTGNKKEPPG
jgi:hypothetical protein